MRHKYRKLMMSAAIITSCMTAVPVYAGGINSNEERVIAVASGTFEYEGKTYRAYSSYVQKLRSYLSQDDVDLTSEQCSEAIAEIRANVKEGIDSGYIYEVVEAPDTKEEDSSDATEGNKPEDETEPEKAVEPTKVPETAEPSKTPEAEGSDQPVIPTLMPDKQEQDVEGDTISNTNPPAESEGQDGVQIDITEGSNDGVIKNTGFSIAPAIKMTAVLICVYAANLFTTVCISHNKNKGNEVN